MLIAVKELLKHPVRFEEVFAPGHIDYVTEGLSQVTALKVRGTATLADRDIYIRGDLGTELEILCARCLTPVHRKVRVNFDLCYHPLEDCPRQEELKVPPGEEELGFYQGNGLLVEDLVREQVLLTLPMRVVCREDCRGLCPQCGCDRNHEACDCVAPADARWEGLRGL